MKILVQVKNVYGNELIYPICEKAKTFARIAGTKTLSKTILLEIYTLGYKVEQYQTALQAIPSEV